MIKTVENKDEIIKNSINFIWKATDRKAAAVIFNGDSLLSATLTLNNGTSNIINLDAPSCVIINRENFLKIVNLVEVNEKDQIIIDDKNHEAIQAEDINLDRQPSGLSLEIDFVNMDIQESNMESSFDVDDMDNSSEFNKKDEIIQKNKAQNLNSNNQEPIGSESDEYDDTDEETGERLFDALASSFRKSKEISSAKSSTYRKINERNGIERIPSTLTDDSPLPSEKEAVSVLQDLEISEGQLSSKHSDNNKVNEPVNESIASSSKSQQSNRNNVLSIALIINNQSDIENERTSLINEEPNQNQNNTDDDPESVNVASSTSAEITDAIEKNQDNETQTFASSNLQFDEHSDSDVHPNIGLSSVPVVLVNDPIPESQKCNDPQPNSDSDKEIEEQGDLGSLETQGDTNNESSDLGSTFVNYTTSKFNDLQIGSTAYSKRLKSPLYYAERLNKLRKGEGMSDNFASNTNDLVGMYSQLIVKYFNEDSTLVLLEPLPNQMKDVDSCLKYLQLWEQHFEHYQKEITNQQYKMLKLIYSLSNFFFILLILCQQEQQEEMSPIAL
ncbi:17980_t:CDS:10 [Cetraspora pellucida]|uniref:17980_t:CDS:1 n=1 Tax=Cetraspora pellucida TaxID=1433469 RepID=A0ACA9KRE9_9GLOM|nr:17980_t:CDS:10 [Cetraspora pellucida]